MAKVELFIWWTSQEEVTRIGPEAPRQHPDYVKAQYRLRRACTTSPGGQIWVDERFGPQSIGVWPKTLIADIARDSGGVVFSKRDLSLFTVRLPGMVTDFQLRMVLVSA